MSLTTTGKLLDKILVTDKLSPPKPMYWATKVMPVVSVVVWLRAICPDITMDKILATSLSLTSIPQKSYRTIYKMTRLGLFH